ncbi:hypothetical protein HDU76_002090, partial [Blyttiomyces sp. JEL0837]
VQAAVVHPTAPRLYQVMRTLMERVHQWQRPRHTTVVLMLLVHRALLHPTTDIHTEGASHMMPMANSRPQGMLTRTHIHNGRIINGRDIRSINSRIRNNRPVQMRVHQGIN